MTYRVLAIETSCDDVAVSIADDGKIILSNIVFSQENIHKEFRGVYPEIAARCHEAMIVTIIDKALQQAGILVASIDAVAATIGPGLIGSLVVGVIAAKTLALAWDRPFIGVNHIQGHLYAATLGVATEYPALGVVLSGGHSLMVHMASPIGYSVVATTVDDAIGESFDKVARLLDLSYPGGPSIEKLAKKGDENRFVFKGGNVKKAQNLLSFSGMKTAVLQVCSESKERADIAASFQKSAFEYVFKKIEQLLQQADYKAIFWGGGVVNNSYLRNMSKRLSLPSFFPKKGLSTDNAAMIATLAFHLRDKNLSTTIFPRLKDAYCYKFH